MNCQSCGMPMDKPEDHGGSKPDNLYCKYCTDPQGNLLPRETVRENMIKYHTQVLNKPQVEAESFVDEHMKTMPAWQGEAVTEPAVSEPSEPTPEPAPVAPSITEQPTAPSVTEPAAPEVTTEPPVAEEPAGGAAMPGEEKEETPTE